MFFFKKAWKSLYDSKLRKMRIKKKNNPDGDCDGLPAFPFLY